MPDLGQFVVALMAAILRQPERVEVVSCSSTTFFRHNSPVFYERGGLMAGDDWATSFEDLADVVRCTDEQKVDYAGLKLMGEAKYWCKSAKALIAEELGPNVRIPWERFKREFNDRFFPQAHRQQCARDFQGLK